MRLLPLAFVLVSAAIAPDAAAQGVGYASLTVSTTQAYDDNLFAAGVERAQREDFFARVGPTVNVGYESVPLTLTARYGFEAERYLHLDTLNSALARQDAAIEMRRRASRRLVLDLKGSYLSTQNPGEFNVDSTLVAGRARAERLAARAATSYAWSPLTLIDAGYEFTRDALEGSTTADVQEGFLGVEHGGAAARSTRGLQYRLRSYQFEDGRSERWHVLTGRWTRDLTRRLAIELLAGPRVASGTVLPELGLTVRRLYQKAEWSAGYSRTQTIVFGETGAVDVQRVSGMAVYRADRRVTLSAAPAFAASTRGTARVTIYALDIEAAAATRGGLSIVLAGRTGLQHGTLGGRRDRMPFHSVSVRLSATFHRGGVAARPARTEPEDE